MISMCVAGICNRTKQHTMFYYKVYIASNFQFSSMRSTLSIDVFCYVCVCGANDYVRSGCNAKFLLIRCNIALIAVSETKGCLHFVWIASNSNGNILKCCGWRLVL